MQTHALALALLLTVSSAGILVVADQGTPGVPDLGCQTTAEWRLHDYGPPSSGILVFFPQDGNLEECGNTYGLFVFTDEDCQLLADNGVSGAAYDMACTTDRPADWDGDLEFAHGGAYLVSVTGDGVTSGGLACYDIFGHHPQGGVVTVTDLVASDVFFTVTADFTDPSDPADPLQGPDCGDGIVQPCDPTPPEDSSLPQPLGGGVDTVNALLYSLFNSDGTTCTVGDVRKPCLNSCIADFSPGIDGAYIVFVGPSLSGNSGEPTDATAGHVYL